MDYLYVIIVLIFAAKSYAVTWSGFGTTSQTVNENTDSEVTLWTYTASCNSGADACSCSFSGDSGLFRHSGSTIYKNACSDTDCGSCHSCTPCSTSNGCLSASVAASYSLSVTCNNGSSLETDTQSLTVTITSETPTLAISLPATASASRTDGIGSSIATVSKSSGPPIVEYRESTSVASSYILGTANLFVLSGSSVNVDKDLSAEYSSDYTMGICIYSRRQSSCDDLDISFTGCFERPTCNDVSESVDDTHPVGDTLFTMDVNDPSSHFSPWSSTWQDLTFTIDSTDLSVVTIDSDTGEITSTGNVTVYPSYPTKVYTITVRIANSASCSYTSTCVMTLTVTFTNWDITITSLDASWSVHEDTDARTRAHSIITYDYNYEEEDNVTCVITDNPDTTLFDIAHDGNHTYDSYSIYKKRCLDTGCGFICDLNRGCLNHNLTRTYVIEVTCSDAYGSSDVGYLTVNVQVNQAPIWRNLPNTITLDSNAVADLDVVFSILYTDAEDETLTYNYTVTPSQPTPELFEFDTTGNYFNNVANITSLIFQWDQDNSTYDVYICGVDRRNMRCETLTINIRDYCGPTPTCDDDSITVADTFGVGGTLFTINAPAPATGSFSSLSYAFVSETPELFDIDGSSGVLTSMAALSVSSPPSNTTFSLVGQVYDTNACGYGVCSLSVTVTFTNYDISIDNMVGLSEDIHEDTTASVSLHTVLTSDANAIDSVTCVVNETASTPPNNNIFYTRETDTGTNVYELLSIEGPGFDYDVVTTYTIVVDCMDAYGSSDTASMTVNILENQHPNMTNLFGGATIIVDPMTVFSGARIFTLTTTDAEDDPLTYSCFVDNTWVPLECPSDGIVTLRRNVTVPDEDNVAYDILMCINETVHNHGMCNTLTVNFTSSKTNPEIDNLPAIITFDEATSVGTSLFNVSVNDPDTFEIHTFRMDVKPDEYQSYFSLDVNTGSLSLAVAVDYEIQNNFNITFWVKDNYLPGLESKVLSWSVADVNEPPTLIVQGDTFNTTEGDIDMVIGTINFTCTDPDIGETIATNITSGAFMSYFSFNDTTGQLTYAQDWDLESNSLPLLTTFEITCFDAAGLSSTAIITVNIAPVNEFAPVLNTYNESYVIFTNQSIIESLLDVTATDADYGDDSFFSYSIAGDGVGVEHFRLTSAGQLFLASQLSWTYNYTFQFTIEVSDGESSPLTSSISVTVEYIAPEPALPTRPSYCLLCTTEGIVVVSALCLEAFLILVFLFHAFVRMRGWTLCQLEPSRKPRRKRTPTSDIEIYTDNEDEGEDLEDEEPKGLSTYRPASTCLNRAIPRKRPPSAFVYREPSPIPVPEPAVYGDPPVELSDIGGAMEGLSSFNSRQSFSSSLVPPTNGVPIVTQPVIHLGRPKVPTGPTLIQDTTQIPPGFTVNTRKVPSKMFSDKPMFGNSLKVESQTDLFSRHSPSFDELYGEEKTFSSGDEPLPMYRRSRASDRTWTVDF